MALEKTVQGAAGTTLELATVFRQNSDGSVTVTRHTFGFGADNGHDAPECKIYRENSVTVTWGQALSIALRLRKKGYRYVQDCNL